MAALEFSEFEKQERAALHQEMLEARRSLGRLEWACGMGALLAFSLILATAAGFVAYQGLLWLMPIAFPVYGCVKAWAISSRMGLIGRYLAGEGTPASGSLFAQLERPMAARVVGVFMWALFLASTVAGSLAGYADFRDQCPGQLRDACVQGQGVDAPEVEEGTAPMRQTTRLDAAAAPDFVNEIVRKGPAGVPHA